LAWDKFYLSRKQIAKQNFHTHVLLSWTEESDKYCQILNFATESKFVWDIEAEVSA